MKIEGTPFRLRLVDAIKKNPLRLIFWVLLELIAIKLFTLHMIFGSIAMGLFSLLFYPYLRIARDYIIEFNKVDHQFVIHYLKYNTSHTLEIPISNCKFINGINASYPALESHVWMVRRNNGSTIVIQYKCSDWDEEKLQELFNYSL